MKSNFFLILFILFFNESYAESLLITAKNISLDKNKNISVFENEVVVKTKDKTLKSDYAKYDRSNGFLILKENISVHDEKNNKMFADYAEYNEKSEILKTIGDTKVETVENYILNGKDLKVDGKNKIIISEKKSILRDEEGNLITLDNFEYLTNDSLFKSIGLIEIIDNKKNKYLFSQVYIDTKKKEILGTDSKSYLNSNEFKIHLKNKPRIFKFINIKKEKSSFEKAVFTLCNYSRINKCPLGR